MYPQTIFDKIWSNHVVNEEKNGECLIYIDRHLIHEVTSPQAFEGLKTKNRVVRKPNLTLAVPDHNVPTIDRTKGIADIESRIQVDTLLKNCKDFSVPFFNIDDERQGIVHIIGPEQGFTLPGTTLVCGDSHTSTHGAFGSLAFGIGTSEVEHVLSTQTLIQKPAKNFLIKFVNTLGKGVTAKDVILYVIGQIGTAGGTGYVLEYAGEIIDGMSMEERMTICNMSIEAGARAGLIAPDEKTLDYLYGKPLTPKGEDWDMAVKYWLKLKSDPGAKYEKTWCQRRQNLGEVPTFEERSSHVAQRIHAGKAATDELRLRALGRCARLTRGALREVNLPYLRYPNVASLHSHEIAVKGAQGTAREGRLHGLGEVFEDNGRRRGRYLEDAERTWRHDCSAPAWARQIACSCVHCRFKRPRCVGGARNRLGCCRARAVHATHHVC